MKWIIIASALLLAACSNDAEESGGNNDSRLTGATETTFPEDETFVGVLCPAFLQLCACNAGQTSCPGNDAAVGLYSCLWYAADFGDDGKRTGLGEGLLRLESSNEHLCRTMDMPGSTCAAKMTTAFGGGDQPYRGNIWEFLSPKPTDSAALIQACEGVPPVE